MNQRARIMIRGAVQGVGFRPFVYRLATELHLCGWVLNSAAGVTVEAEGPRDRLEELLLRLETERPERSHIQSMEYSYLDPAGLGSFEIRSSVQDGLRTTLVLPDIATCRECLADVLDPGNRRFRYPFTNCTNCGPRFSIIKALPYDRCNTSMKCFEMCEECRREYEDPRDRRFHAQPNACPTCGPQIELWDAAGGVLADRERALRSAADEIRNGKVVALKGLGGFHLIADARNREALDTLRSCKHREEKPFALMAPSIEEVKRHCHVSRMEERLLASAESPIVLLSRKYVPDEEIADSVAPGNPYLGVMLPYTPLHHLLLRELAFPVVATSGNLSDEPICTDEREALDRLQGMADLFLVHNRPIVRHVDDSIARIMLGRELLLRRARGYAPLPLHLKKSAGAVLAVGGHLKNSVALAVGDNVFVSQHIGDLETPQAAEAFRSVISDFEILYDARPDLVVADLHPDYLSSRFARTSGLPLASVQHHYAHIAACMAENDLDGPVLGVAWDGTGYGPDGTIWGGEFLATDGSSFRRVATFRPFRLPGGTKAIREPRRTALGVLFEALGEGVFDRSDLPPLQAFKPEEVAVLRRMLRQGLNAPVTTSVGRLFDAAASLAGLRQLLTYEGQAAMELEFATMDDGAGISYPFALEDRRGKTDSAFLLIDWAPSILTFLEDLKKQIPVGIVAARFHRTLAAIIVEVARNCGLERVALSGGCFQNRTLTELAVDGLERAGFRPYWHQRIPPNDGGIAMGQIAAVLGAIRKGE